jgi:glycosyltransferase involved in cell wall biosynthesis
MRKQVQSEIVVIIPAYNAAKNIRGVVSGIPETVKVNNQTFITSVVIVEDGSKDDTYEQALRTRATVLRHVMNSGAGAATRTGMKYVQGLEQAPMYAITMDADGQHDAGDLGKLLKCVIKKDADIVIGNRLHGGNKMPLHRSLGNKGISFISRVLFGITAEDTQSGLRLFKVEKLPSISNYTIDRYGFCTETLWLAHKAKLRVVEVPTSVVYSDETLAGGQNNWGVIDMMLDLLWIRMVG